MKYYVLEIFKIAPKSFRKFGNQRRNIKLAEKGFPNGARFHTFDDAEARKKFIEAMENSGNENIFRITTAVGLIDIGFRLYEKKTTKKTISKLIKDSSFYL